MPGWRMPLRLAPRSPLRLLLNGHFGALLVAKLIVPLFPTRVRHLFPVLSYLALATALYVAIRALTENSPRRLLAFIALSQSACILAGLESRTAGRNHRSGGALVRGHGLHHGPVRNLAAAEVRFGENLTASRISVWRNTPRGWRCYSWYSGWRWLACPAR